MNYDGNIAEESPRWIIASVLQPAAAAIRSVGFSHRGTWMTIRMRGADGADEVQAQQKRRQAGWEAFG